MVDTGAKVSVCGMTEEKSWGILDKLKPSNAKMHPYNSILIKVRGTALCSVTFKNRTIAVKFYILPGLCQPILDGNKATQFQTITIDKEDVSVFNPVKMIDTDNLNGEFVFEISSIVRQYPNNFKGLGKMKDYQVKLYSDGKIKPVPVPPRSVPYHLQARVADSLESMIKNSIIEEHTSNELPPWMSCAVIVPKDDGFLRVTLDARNFNNAFISSKCLIPKQEDIKT